jgi:hypothetical protein
MHDQERVFLSYEGATFRRSLIFLLLALALLFTFELVNFPKHVSAPAQAGAPSLAKILLGFAIIMLFLFGIADGLFVTGQRLFVRKVSFDDFNLYITGKSAERAIPLACIHDIFLTAAIIRTPTRGALSVYRITFSQDQGEQKLYVKVYPKTNRQFNQFSLRVRELNPEVQIRQWATSLDWLFARKK